MHHCDAGGVDDFAAQDDEPLPCHSHRQGRSFGRAGVDCGLSVGRSPVCRLDRFDIERLVDQVLRVADCLLDLRGTRAIDVGGVPRSASR